MLFPKQKMRFTTNYPGKTDAEGWIVLDVTNTDLEGVNKIYLAMADIQSAIEKGDTAEDRLKKARALLGGFGNSEEES
jgi:hypothetical protein